MKKPFTLFMSVEASEDTQEKRTSGKQFTSEKSVYVICFSGVCVIIGMVFSLVTTMRYGE